MTVQLDGECLDGTTVETPASAGPAAGAAASPGAGSDAVAGAGDQGPDVTALLDTMVERRATVDRAEADVLALVVEFADAHPASADGITAVGITADGITADGIFADGPGTGVAETSVVTLAARLGVSYRSAAGLLTEAVELRDRLPRLWALVQAGRLQSWKARQVVRATFTLSDAVACFIDGHAAVSGRRNQVPDLRKLVILAINRCDPELAEGLEEAAAVHRDVRFDFSASTDAAATARLEATLDLLDALDLDATITDLAAQMGRLGDGSPIGVRRAHALGLLGDPQRTLDLFGDPVAPAADDDTSTATARATGADTDRDTATGTGSRATAASGTDVVTEVFRPSTTERVQSRMPWAGQTRWNSQVGHLYLHLDAADLRALQPDGLPTDSTGGGGVDLERLGAASLTLVREWLGRVTRVSVRPVLDLAAEDAVDQHDPPPAIREQVILRDGRCVFPGCGIHARACDQDHTDPYIPIDLGGPPGQTRPGNLACLCRRHHRMKTHHGWNYRRTRDGTYTWTDPHGVSYQTAPQPLHRTDPTPADLRSPSLID